jgi:hypothetical protein
VHKQVQLPFSVSTGASATISRQPSRRWPMPSAQGFDLSQAPLLRLVLVRPQPSNGT